MCIIDKVVMEIEKLLKFCKEWLSAWTGNIPEKLLSYYAENAYYQDPAFPKGLVGHEQILPYFEKLLSGNPSWKWELEELFKTEKGFVFKWKATIPVGSKILSEKGMDIVELENKKISRNEVYFDRFDLLTTIRELKTM